VEQTPKDGDPLHQFVIINDKPKNKKIPTTTAVITQPMGFHGKRTERPTQYQEQLTDNSNNNNNNNNKQSHWSVSSKTYYAHATSFYRQRRIIPSVRYYHCGNGG